MKSPEELTGTQPEVQEYNTVKVFFDKRALGPPSSRELLREFVLWDLSHSTQIFRDSEASEAMI